MRGKMQWRSYGPRLHALPPAKSYSKLTVNIGPFNRPRLLFKVWQLFSLYPVYVVLRRFNIWGQWLPEWMIFLTIMMMNDIRGWLVPKLWWHLSYGWGKTPEKISTRKTNLTGNWTRAARLEAMTLHLDHSGCRMCWGASPSTHYGVKSVLLANLPLLRHYQWLLYALERPMVLILVSQVQKLYALLVFEGKYSIYGLRSTVVGEKVLFWSLL